VTTIRKTNSAFVIGIALLICCSAGRFALLSPALAAGPVRNQDAVATPVPKQSTPSEHDLAYLVAQKATPGGKCIDLSQKPRRAIFHGLQRVFLYVDIKPTFYDYAVQCHGHETDCIGESAKKFETSQDHEKHIRDLVNEYNNYPAPLHRDNLTKVFSESIKENIFPWLKPGPGPNCETPGIQVLDSKSVWVAKNYDATSLLIWVKLYVLDYTQSQQQPRLATLRYSLYRPGLSEKDALAESGSDRSTAFAVDLPEDKMAAIIHNIATPFSVGAPLGADY
jgi:hypothetical protein